ncbi:MAG: peptidase M13 [Gammaproteobacteria bacterium]|nr:peptidase M13 [Gammaproteobacteria bacterium]MDH5584113.1 peptidase M13 [Gammaproteobacteria bacterium]
MNKQIIGALALLTLVACSKEAAEPPVAKALGSGITLENMDTSVRPGDDFFSYVNGGWVAKTEIPADKGRFGTFDLLRDASQDNVKVIIEESASGDFAKGTDEQKVGDLYRSYMDLETRDSRGIEPLLPELKRIDAIASRDELTAYFADAMKRNFDAPMAFGQVEDFKDPTRYIIYVTQSGLGLPDREYYLKEDPSSAEIRAKYVEHIEKMFKLAGFPDGAAAATTIMALETRLANENMTKEQSRRYAENYTMIPLEDLPKLMPNMNWQGYLDAGGLAGLQLDGLVFFETDYMKALDGIIAATDLDTWKTYLYWSALNNAAARLTTALDQQNFEFYGKTLSGTEEQRALWRRAVDTVNGSLGEVVGKVYVKRHFPPEAKERMLTLVGNLVKAYEKSIKELEWMSADTKAEALDKLSKFTPKIGYPDEWRDYSKLDIEADDFYGNLERAALAEYQRLMDRHNGPVDRTEWGMTPQTVNAYYNPLLNEIVFPAAILQPPFFNVDAEDAVNYGGIGAVIGHEIGHGFDDSGSTFDGNGVMRNWWTDADRAEFEKRTSKLVEQYDAFLPFEDLSVNGEFTLGENIGDLGGIGIGLLAYQMSLNGKEAPVIDGFTGVQRVFLGFGQVWSGKYRDETLRLQIETDPHSPSMYRANGAVRNVPEFYEAFEVSADDALYLGPDDRVKIW